MIPLGAARPQPGARPHPARGPPGLARRGWRGSWPRDGGRGPAGGRSGSSAWGPRRDPDLLEPRDVLFVDEIHRLSRTAEEVLYPAMEDFQLDIVIGKGPRRVRSARPAPVTLVGATTRTGLLTMPLRDRFGLTFRLDLYSTTSSPAIVRRSARILDVRSRPTPQSEIVAPRARHAADREPHPPPCPRRRPGASRRGRSRPPIAEEALALLEVDEAGLERFDRDLLRAVVDKFGGGPVACRRSQSRSARSPRRSRTSTSRTCSSSASSSARRAAAIVTDLGRAHVGSPPEKKKKPARCSRRRTASSIPSEDDVDVSVDHP